MNEILTTNKDRNFQQELQDGINSLVEEYGCEAVARNLGEFKEILQEKSEIIAWAESERRYKRERAERAASIVKRFCQETRRREFELTTGLSTVINTSLYIKTPLTTDCKEFNKWLSEEDKQRTCKSWDKNWFRFAADGWDKQLISEDEDRLLLSQDA